MRTRTDEKSVESLLRAREVQWSSRITALPDFPSQISAESREHCQREDLESQSSNHDVDALE